MQFHGLAKCSSIAALTSFILKMMVFASGVSIVSISAKVALRVDTTPGAGLRRRSYVALTSAEVSFWPSWKTTLLWSLNVYVFRSGDTVQDCARSPLTAGYL